MCEMRADGLDTAYLGILGITPRRIFFRDGSQGPHRNPGRSFFSDWAEALRGASFLRERSDLMRRRRNCENEGMAGLILAVSRTKGHISTLLRQASLAAVAAK